MPDTATSTGMVQWIDTLMALRMSTDGTFAKTQLNQTTNVVEGGVPPYAYLTPSGLYKQRESLDDPLMLSIITNADTGATAFVPTFNGPTVTPTQTTLYPITAGAAGAGVTLDVPSFTPVLQREDGNYVGTDSLNHLVALGAAGTLWQTTIPDGFGGALPNYPRYLAEDGSILTSSVPPQPGAQGTFYIVDPTGTVTSQVPDNGLSRSWFGDQYASTSAEGIASVTPTLDFRLGQSFAAIQQGGGGANQAGNGVHIKQEPYPHFPKCTSNLPATLCPYDSLLVGLQALQQKVGGNCIGADNVNDCSKYVFEKIGTAVDQQAFSRFVSRRPQFFDGTRSNLLLQDLSGDLGSLDAQSLYVNALGTHVTVADEFARLPGLTALAYLQPTTAQSPTGRNGLKIFFRPSSVCTNSVDSTSSCQISNQIEIWHEGLHEFYGIFDTSIQTLLGIKSNANCTANIDWYIRFAVFGQNTTNPCP